MASKARYIANLVLFFLLMFVCTLGINFIQFWGMFLYWSRPLYRRYMRFTQRMFGSLMLITTYILAPLEIIMTGQHESLNSQSVAPIIANHQIYTDWWYVWLFAWYRNAHGDLKIILKDSLKSLPIFGWGMRCFEFIFLARKWEKDRKTLVESLKRSNADKTPLWLLLFPEGTVITDDTQEKSSAYAKKADIKFDCEHVLIPRSKGIWHILRNFKHDSEYLYDFTMGYSGLVEGKGSPYDQYPLGKVFFEGQGNMSLKGPKSIHIHVDRFRIADLPGMNTDTLYHADEDVPVYYINKAEFDEWMLNRFKQKNELMKEFLATNNFPVESMEGKGLKQSIRIDPQFIDWISITGLIVASITSWSWLFL